jgi:hypothetical protein
VKPLLLPALLLALLLALAGCGGDGDEPAPPPGRFLSAQQTLTPPAHLFGDPVEARLDVVVDRANLDPDGIRVRLDFLPYRIVGGLRRSRHDFSRFTRLRFEATLRCLTVQCVPTRLASVLGDQEGRGERRTFRFDPAQILYDDPKTGETRRLRRAAWPPLDSISRLSAEGIPFEFRFLPGAEFTATVAPPPDPEYRAPAWLVAALLLAAAAALLALPGRYVARWLRRRRRQRAEEAAGVPPLELALRRVERARDHGDPEEQREALEALAHALDRNGGVPDPRDVRRLAWSAEPPARDALTGLVATLREGA